MDQFEVRGQRLAAAAEAARAAAEDARTARDEWIAEADGRGYRPIRIARITGLGPSHLSRILAKLTARAQHEAAVG